LKLPSDVSKGGHKERAKSAPTLNTVSTDGWLVLAIALHHAKKIAGRYVTMSISKN
jgi:hypothetical protein